MSESKLAQFLATKKLHHARVLAASHNLESLRPEDRVAKLERRRQKAEGAEKKEVVKPRSGRAVTDRALATALAGGVISGPTKQRILRAINHLLEQKKAEKVDLKALF